jgi:hypothetical protein
MDKPSKKADKVRIAHVLKPTKSQARPKRLVFFHTETDQEVRQDGSVLHTLQSGMAKLVTPNTNDMLTVRDSLAFSDVGDLWDQIINWRWKKFPTYLVADRLVFHLAVCNGFRELASRDMVLKGFFTKGTVGIYRWRSDDHKIVGLDNGNFFADALKDIPTTESKIDRMIELWRTWVKFLDDNECGAFKITLASTSFNTWRHRHMKDRVHIHVHPKATALERSSYRGGRSECLWVGHREDGPFYYLDINNMYGHIMATSRLPCGLWNWHEHGDLFRLRYKLERYAVIARVGLVCNENWFPLLYKGHTAYPTGQFVTTLTTPELKLALERGWIQEVYEMSWYRQHKIFRDYALTLMDLRQHYDSEEQPGYSKITKLLVNSFYGKFGQRGMKQVIIGECSPNIIQRETVYDVIADKWFDQVYLAGHIYRETREGESFHSFPAIAAHVTAYARMYLMRLMKKVPKRHLFYVDTDGLIVDEVGKRALEAYIEPHEAGFLKVEAESPWLTINAPKDYSMQARVRLKGISPDATLLDTDIYQQTLWLKMNGLIQAGIKDGYMQTKVTKHISHHIYSGWVGSGGWVSPFHLKPDVLPVSSVRIESLR